VGERRCHFAQQRTQMCPEGGLRHEVSLHMARAWLEEACAQSS
jgi:hypothetical protein